MNEIALANFYRVLNDADRFPTERELAEAAIAAKDELNALRAHPQPMGSAEAGESPEWMKRAADEISFLYESWKINETPLPSFSEIEAVIKKWRPFMETTTGVTLSIERYNELIEKEFAADHTHSIAVNTDGTLVHHQPAETAASEIMDEILSERLHATGSPTAHIAAIIRKHLPEREGYVSVPRVMTEEMEEAAVEAMIEAKEAALIKTNEIRAKLHMEPRKITELAPISWIKEFYAAAINAAPK